ncbi:hypothetical protein BGZ63DRAFT_228788 [Mariannaea sp. PMI_226]|nr:hypothetical protein BGZ63DRAFT_228788 [Mariannaea sp. PMI_226]
MFRLPVSWVLWKDECMVKLGKDARQAGPTFSPRLKCWDMHAGDSSKGRFKAIIISSAHLNIECSLGRVGRVKSEIIQMASSFGYDEWKTCAKCSRAQVQWVASGRFGPSESCLVKAKGQAFQMVTKSSSLTLGRSNDSSRGGDKRSSSPWAEARREDGCVGWQ